MARTRAGVLRRCGGAFTALALACGPVPLVGVAQPALAASPTTTTLVVNKGGDRTGTQTVAGLPGAVFDFYPGTSGTRPGPGDTPIASCTTDADGRCAVDVPGRTGTNQGYWVVERSAPSGWRLIDTLDTGGNTTTPTTYNGYFTGPVYNNVTYNLPQPSTGNTNRTARGPQWADARDDPPLPAQCGLRVALLVDVSGSISPYLNDVKAAANGFVDALTGTPSQIGVYSFSSTAATVLNPVPVSDTAGATTVQSAINGLTAGGTTNWDAGLFQVAVDPMTYDLVIMLTDGNPTVYGPTPVQGPGSFTRFREVENGVFSANAVKARGSRVVAVGVGAGVSGSGDNLAAVSGPVAGEDYIQTGYEDLAEVFRQLALTSCAGTVSVVKQVIPFGGTVADAQPAGGWTISTSTPEVTPTSAVTDDATGGASFDANLQGAPSRPVTLTETLQPGYTLVPQAGDNAACATNGDPVPVTNSGPLGFTVDAQASAIVSCVVLNQAPDPSAQIVVNKLWRINGQTYQDPAQPTEFVSALQLDDIPEPAWSTEYSGFQAGQSVTVGEEVDLALLPPNCTYEATGDLGPQTLNPGLNTFAVTNTVTCATSLELRKTIQNPYYEQLPPLTDWTLNAYPTGSSTPVISGTTGVSGPADPAVTYSLAETSLPGFTQTVVPGATIQAPATGSWSCRLAQRGGPAGPPGFDGDYGLVTVQIGQTAICTSTNAPLPAAVTLVKEVENRHGGTATPQDWVLEGRPVPQVSAPTVRGRSGERSVTDATVYPGVPLQLGETDGPTGYQQVGQVECVDDVTGDVVPTPRERLNPTFGQSVTCTFRNRDLAEPPRLTLVKRVSPGDADPTSWTLTATPDNGGTPISGVSGSPGVTGVTAYLGVGYRLTESDGPKGYREYGAPRCVLTGTDTEVPVVDRVVTLSSGQDVTCTYHNGRHLPITGMNGMRLGGIAAGGVTAILTGAGLLLLVRRRRIDG